MGPARAWSQAQRPGPHFLLNIWAKAQPNPSISSPPALSGIVRGCLGLSIGCLELSQAASADATADTIAAEVAHGVKNKEKLRSYWNPYRKAQVWMIFS